MDKPKIGDSDGLRTSTHIGDPTALMLSLKVRRASVHVASWACETFYVGTNKLVVAGHVASSDGHLSHIGFDVAIIAIKVAAADGKTSHVRTREIGHAHVVFAPHNCAVEIGITKVALDTRSAEVTTS